MRLKSLQKSLHFTLIKRQANSGLGGILREGRGRGTSPSLIKNQASYPTFLIKKSGFRRRGFVEKRAERLKSRSDLAGAAYGSRNVGAGKNPVSGRM